MEFQKLQGMKYADLQKLAKVCGVRANMKVWIPILKVPRSSLQGSTASGGGGPAHARVPIHAHP